MVVNVALNFSPFFGVAQKNTNHKQFEEKQAFMFLFFKPLFI